MTVVANQNLKKERKNKSIKKIRILQQGCSHRANAYDIHTLVAPSSYSVECCDGIKDTKERVEYVYIKLFQNLFCKIDKFEMVIKAF